MQRLLVSTTGKAMRKLIAISSEQALNIVQQVKPGITYYAEDLSLFVCSPSCALKETRSSVEKIACGE